MCSNHPLMASVGPFDVPGRSQVGENVGGSLVQSASELTEPDEHYGQSFA